MIWAGYRYPVYRDEDHLYTIGQTSKGPFAILMAANEPNPLVHVIRVLGAGSERSALEALHDMAKEYCLENG